jgi:thiosulfate dehydrogenase
MFAVCHKILPALLLSAVTCLLCFGFSGCTEQSHRAAQSTAKVRLSPESPEMELVREGKLVFDETPKFAPGYVGNKLACDDCHIKSGTAAYAAPMIDLAGLFPMFNKRAGHTISLQNRIQECFSRSEAGKPLPIDSPQMKALVAYINWLSRDGAKGQPYSERGFVKLPKLTGNPVRGRVIYMSQCAGCHGVDGAGVPPILPAVWGPNSYNDGAGMNNLAKMAAFVFHNMPQNHPRTLTPQQAFDVSAFVHTMPRPRFDQAYKHY